MCSRGNGSASPADRYVRDDRGFDAFEAQEDIKAKKGGLGGLFNRN